MKQETRVWVEGTCIAALAMALSFIPVQIGSSFAISLGQIPLTLYALRRGTKPALFAAFIWGILHFPLSQVYYLSVPQVLIEYPIAFTFAGFAGVTSQKLQQALINQDTGVAKQQMVVGTFIGVAARYFWHFVAGVIFWGAYALWGLGPVAFSFLMNGLSGLATGIVTTITLWIVMDKMPKLFLPDNVLVASEKK